MDNQLYLDSPKIQKFTLFNTDIRNKYNYTLFPFDEYGNNDYNIFSIFNKKEYDKLKKEIFTAIKKHKNKIYYKNKEDFDNYINNHILNNENKHINKSINNFDFSFDIDYIEKSKDIYFLKKIRKK
jgi:hypothetical protein